MTDRERLGQLEQEAVGEIRALLATPGAFERWLDLVGSANGTTELMAQIERFASEERREQDWAFAYGHWRDQVAHADAYAAEVRDRFEGALLVAAESALVKITGDREAVEQALAEHGAEAVEEVRRAV